MFAKTIFVAALVLAGSLTFVHVTSRTRGRRPPFAGSGWQRATWTTPPLDTLPPPPRSRWRTFGLVVLRMYLALAVVLALVRIVRLMAGG